ncbi:MAG: heavy metal-responsive transcriptional regulator [Gemmatimonadota bacterium]
MQVERWTVGALAARVGVTPDTLRYYERLGLLPAPPRSDGGYRLYEPEAAERVAFIRKARALGLSLDEVGEVLRVADAGTPPCEHVRAALERHMQEVEARMAELESLRSTLTRALRRSRSLPVARSCVCHIIESQEVPRPAPRRSTARRRVRAAHTRTHKEE